MAPIVHGLESEYSDRIVFYYLDADDPATQVFQSKFGFQVQPEFYLLDGQGNIVQSWRGAVDEAEFRAAFDSLLK